MRDVRFSAQSGRAVRPASMSVSAISGHRQNHENLAIKIGCQGGSSRLGKREPQQRHASEGVPWRQRTQSRGMRSLLEARGSRCGPWKDAICSLQQEWLSARGAGRKRVTIALITTCYSRDWPRSKSRFFSAIATQISPLSANSPDISRASVFTSGWTSGNSHPGNSLHGCIGQALQEVAHVGVILSRIPFPRAGVSLSLSTR